MDGKMTTPCIRRFHANSSDDDVLKGIDLTGKTVLITGTTSGLGAETARALAMRGARVVMANRNMSAAQKVKERICDAYPEAHVELLQCDLSSLASVRDAAIAFLMRYKQLHVLILNAGVYGPQPTKSRDGYENTFATNHLGHFYLTKLLTNVLRSSAPSRVVVISSICHANTKVPAKIDKAALSCLIPESTAKTSSYRLYSMSKLCNVLFAFQLADKELQHGIIVNAVHPGTAVPTAIAKNTTLGKIVFFLTKPFTKTIQCGASTIVYCAVHPDVQTITSRYFEDNWYSEKRLDRKRARNETLQNALWQESERLIAVFEPKTA